MWAAIKFQCAAALLALVLAGGLVGTRGAVSAGLAAVACVVPNLLFVLRLKSMANRPGESFPASFFIGEFVKVLATAGLLVVAVMAYADLHWPSFMGGLVLVLQSGFFAFWKKS